MIVHQESSISAVARKKKKKLHYDEMKYVKEKEEATFDPAVTGKWCNIPTTFVRKISSVDPCRWTNNFNAEQNI